MTSRCYSLQDIFISLDCFYINSMHMHIIYVTPLGQTIIELIQLTVAISTANQVLNSHFILLATICWTNIQKKHSQLLLPITLPTYPGKSSIIILFIYFTSLNFACY